MHTQTLKTTVSLSKNWTEEDLIEYNKKMARLQRTVTALFSSKELEVESFNLTIEVNVGTAAKKLDDDFWVKVATGQYDEELD